MVRLRRSTLTAPGLRRRRYGRGVGYLDANGARVTEEAVLERIAQLAIPPAWTEVWICPEANGHIQATGVDAAGRRQYLYHPAWRARKDDAKFARMLELAASLPAARRRIARELRGDGLGRERVLAGAFRLLDVGALRVGSARYADENGSYGLTTLLAAHASVREGTTIHLRFPAKSGQRWESTITDAELATLITALKRRGGRARLLAWQDERGMWRPLRPDELNADIRARTECAVSAKDFRTLHGTLAAALCLAEAGPQPTTRARQRAIRDAMCAAAEVLGNTPTIARTSYVDPRIVDRYERGDTISPARGSGRERALIELLKG